MPISCGQVQYPKRKALVNQERSEPPRQYSLYCPHSTIYKKWNKTQSPWNGTFRTGLIGDLITICCPSVYGGNSKISCNSVLVIRKCFCKSSATSHFVLKVVPPTLGSTWSKVGDVGVGFCVSGIGILCSSILHEVFWSLHSLNTACNCTCVCNIYKVLLARLVPALGLPWKERAEIMHICEIEAHNLPLGAKALVFQSTHKRYSLNQWKSSSWKALQNIKFQCPKTVYIWTNVYEMNK